MPKLKAECVAMGVRAHVAQKNGRTYRTASFWFREDGETLEVSISDENEALFKLMQLNEMKPCKLTANVREYKGMMFLEAVAVELTHGAPQQGPK